jgi:hypothetical protein
MSVRLLTRLNLITNIPYSIEVSRTHLKPPLLLLSYRVELDEGERRVLLLLHDGPVGEITGSTRCYYNFLLNSHKGTLTHEYRIIFYYSQYNLNSAQFWNMLSHYLGVREFLLSIFFIISAQLVLRTTSLEIFWNMASIW